MKQYKLHIINIFFLLISAGFASHVSAQMKVGNNPTQLNSSAILELESNNKGLLLPRVALTSTSSPAPLSSFSHGLMIYNTATQNDVTPGMYYCDGTKWLKMLAGQIAQAPTNSWNTSGNNGTNTNTHFLGTTDNMGLQFRTNNLERMMITAGGRVGIGTTTPTAMLEVKGQVVIDTLTAGNAQTDDVVVSNNGRLKTVAASSFVTGVQKKIETVITAGQTIFTTPAPYTDVNKIMLFRNGVQISFTPNNSNSITSEIPCAAGDEIRIIQLL